MTQAGNADHLNDALLYSVSVGGQVVGHLDGISAPPKPDYIVVNDGHFPASWVVYECTACLSRFQFNLFSQVEKEDAFSRHKCWPEYVAGIDWADDLNLSGQEKMIVYQSQHKGAWAPVREKALQVGRQLGKSSIKKAFIIEDEVEYTRKPKAEPELPTYEKFCLDVVTDYDTLTKLLPPNHEVSEPPVVEYFRKPPLDMHLVMTVKVNTVPFQATYTLTTEEVFPRQGQGDVRDNMAAAMECLLKDIGYSVRRSFDGR